MTSTTQAKSDVELLAPGPLEPEVRYGDDLAGVATFSFASPIAAEAQWSGPTSASVLMKDLEPTHGGLTIWLLDHVKRPPSTEGVVDANLEVPAEPGYLDWLAKQPALDIRQRATDATVGGLRARTMRVALPADPTDAAGATVSLASDLSGFETINTGEAAFVAVVDQTILVLVVWRDGDPAAEPMVDQLIDSLDLTVEK